MDNLSIGIILVSLPGFAAYWYKAKLWKNFTDGWKPLKIHFDLISRESHFRAKSNNNWRIQTKIDSIELCIGIW